MVEPGLAIVLAFIGLVLGFIVQQITGMDLVKLTEILGAISFLLPFTFTIPLITSNPNPDSIAIFICDYINGLVSLVFGEILGVIAGAIFDGIKRMF